VIAGEIAIGLAVSFGLLTRLAAVAGLAINLVFFLSASWSVYPYFLGSDIVFVAAWLTLAIAGPGAFALDPLVADLVAEVTTRPVQRLVMGSWQPLQSPVSSLQSPALTPVTEGERTTNDQQPITNFSRREAIVGGLVTCVLLVLGLAPRVRLGGGAAAAGSPPTAQPTPGPSPTSVPSSAGVVNLSQLPVNSAFPTTDPKSGDPALIVHAANNKVYAYDAVCTHAGCATQYDPSYKLIVCPCHGGAFDPTQGAAVVAGPPPAPLTELPIHVDSGGNVHWG